MFKKTIIITLISLSILSAKTFNLEALYGYSFIDLPRENNRLVGSVQEGGLRAIFFTDNFTHEILGRMSFAPSIKIKNTNIQAKYQNWEAEYRFGNRMDNDMAKLGMLLGSAYLGLGYQSLMTSANNIKKTTNYIYLPFGFWGEDDSGIDALKIRYGLNFKALFFNDSTGSFKYDSLVGGKVYAGVAYTLGGVFDIFGQLFFIYNVPVKNYKAYGIEAGFQF